MTFRMQDYPSCALKQYALEHTNEREVMTEAKQHLYFLEHAVLGAAAANRKKLVEKLIGLDASHQQYLLLNGIEGAAINNNYDLVLYLRDLDTSMLFMDSAREWEMRGAAIGGNATYLDSLRTLYQAYFDIRKHYVIEGLAFGNHEELLKAFLKSMPSEALESAALIAMRAAALNGHFEFAQKILNDYKIKNYSTLFSRTEFSWLKRNIISTEGAHHLKFLQLLPAVFEGKKFIEYLILSGHFTNEKIALRTLTFLKCDKASLALIKELHHVKKISLPYDIDLLIPKAKKIFFVMETALLDFDSACSLISPDVYGIYTEAGNYIPVAPLLTLVSEYIDPMLVKMQTPMQSCCIFSAGDFNRACENYDSYKNQFGGFFRQQSSSSESKNVRVELLNAKNDHARWFMAADFIQQNESKQFAIELKKTIQIKR